MRRPLAPVSASANAMPRHNARLLQEGPAAPGRIRGRELVIRPFVDAVAGDEQHYGIVFPGLPQHSEGVPNVSGGGRIRGRSAIDQQALDHLPVQRAAALLHRLGERLRIGARIVEVFAGKVGIFVHPDGKDIERAGLIEIASAFMGKTQRRHRLAGAVFRGDGDCIRACRQRYIEASCPALKPSFPDGLLAIRRPLTWIRISLHGIGRGLQLDCHLRVAALHRGVRLRARRCAGGAPAWRADQQS